jgi:glycine cleavage system aminomethyltransferase T
MASRTLRLPLQNSAYVCDSCFNSARHLRTAQVVATRAFSNASLRTESTPERTSQLQNHTRRSRTTRLHNSFHGRNVSSRSYSTAISIPQAVTSGVAPLPHRSLIFLSGPDAAKFLQGLITNNVDSTRLSPFYAAFLDARGRVLWDVFVWVWPELVAEQGHWGCYIEVDADEVDTLKNHLKKHKLLGRRTRACEGVE